MAGAGTLVGVGDVATWGAPVIEARPQGLERLLTPRKTVLGPDVLEVLRALPAEGRAGAVVCAAGFTSDHLEVSYDLDIEAKAVAGELGLRFARTASLNADPRLCEALAGLIVAAVPNGQLT